MTEPRTEKKETATGKHKTGAVNLDGLKEILHFLATNLTFADETTQTEFHALIDNLHKSGDPHKHIEDAKKKAEAEAEKAAA